MFKYSIQMFQVSSFYEAESKFSIFFFLALDGAGVNNIQTVLYFPHKLVLARSLFPVLHDSLLQHFTADVQHFSELLG